MNNNKRVFIIEHDRVTGLDIQRQLENNGYSVRRPVSFIDTEKIIGKYTPDLVITDSGIQLQNNFESEKKYFGMHQLPIICTGTITKEEEIKASKGIKIIGTFSKPFDSKKIAALADKYFSK